MTGYDIKTVAPPEVKGLVVQSAIGANVLSWDNVTSPDFAYVRIWRSTQNDRTTAEPIARVQGNTYSDGNLTTGVTYYYWIIAANRFGRVDGTWFPENRYQGKSGTPLRVGTFDVYTSSITEVFHTFDDRSLVNPTDLPENQWNTMISTEIEGSGFPAIITFSDLARTTFRWDTPGSYENYALVSYRARIVNKVTGERIFITTTTAGITILQPNGQVVVWKNETPYISTTELLKDGTTYELFLDSFWQNALDGSNSPEVDLTSAARSIMILELKN